MMYVISAMYAVLVGSVSGWFMYHACAGSKKDRLATGVMWGIGLGIISVMCAFGG